MNFFQVLALAVSLAAGTAATPVPAKEYVVKAPRQIPTAARWEMQRQGCVDVELPQELFES